MKFNDDHLVDRSTLNKDEARAFVTFLDAELFRHEKEQVLANNLALGHDLLADPTSALFWHSAMMRHKEDAEMCKKIIAETKEAHRL